MNQTQKGHIHLISQAIREIADIFAPLGFSVADGPEMEDEWYNFDALNMPKDHPARDMQDTFWIKSKERLVLRTHTSPVQVRSMEEKLKGQMDLAEKIRAVDAIEVAIIIARSFFSVVHRKISISLQFFDGHAILRFFISIQKYKKICKKTIWCGNLR